METVLLVIQVLVSSALIGIILIQRSDSDGFGLGSGSGMNIFSSRGQANFLTRTTAILATIFIVNSLALSILASRSGTPTLLRTIESQESQRAPAVPLAIDEKTSPAMPAPAAESKSEAPAAVKKESPAQAPAVPVAE